MLSMLFASNCMCKLIHPHTSLKDGCSSNWYTIYILQQMKAERGEGVTQRAGCIIRFWEKACKNEEPERQKTGEARVGNESTLRRYNLLYLQLVGKECLGMKSELPSPLQIFGSDQFDGYKKHGELTGERKGP